MKRNIPLLRSANLFFIVALFIAIGCRKGNNFPDSSLKPKAAFTYSILNGGVIPCKVQFTNQSSGKGVYYNWSFGDGETSTQKSPEKNYTASKTFVVKLVATNAAGSDSVQQTIKIHPLATSVVVYLLTPRDVKFNPVYYDSVKSCIVKLHNWYNNQMEGKTFELNNPIVDTITGLHDSAWYNADNGPISGGEPRFYGYYNTYNDMQELLGDDFNTLLYTYVVYVAAPGGGAGTTGFCALGDQDLKGLLGINPENLDPNRWIGGAGHELGHAFGLPHPDNQNWQAIMWTGYLIFPDCILQDEDRSILNASPFFK